MSTFRAFASGLLFLLTAPIATPAAAPSAGKAPAKNLESTVVEHKVTRGETLWSISQKHHTSVGAIMDYNHLPDHSVREGMVLRIPPKVAEAPPAPPKQRIHVVKRGEDFWDIATHYGIKPALLAKANPNINPNRIHEDMELVIPTEAQAEKTAHREEPETRSQTTESKPPAGMIQHTVTEDDTFYSISRRYGVPMDSVIAANPSVRPERLSPGMKVFVPSKNGPPPTNSKTSDPNRKVANAPSKTAESSQQGAKASGSPVARTHKVKEDESIASIAKKYGVSETALLRANKLKEDDSIYVDDVLKIPGGDNEVAASKPTETKGPAATPKPQSASQPKPQAPAPQEKQPVPSNTRSSDNAIRSYIVSAGEDENTICEAFGISKQALYDYNRLAPTAKLKPGDEIAIPRGGKTHKG